ncbi:MAG: dihydroneopterin aldolase [SAR324 cluster bacterium]|nr:dihydroneopterin aldolase [SAR324 cluster bacterium]
MASHRFSAETIHLKNLQVECIVGVRPHERDTPQTLIVTLSFPWDFSAAAASESLSSTVNYSEVAESVRAFLQVGRYQLLETLARELAGHLGETYSLARLHLSVRKPGAVSGSDGAGVSLIWDGGETP